MTEERWERPDASWDQFYAMCTWLEKRRTVRRKLRPWGCACCRRAGGLMRDERSWQAVAASERYADGEVDRPALRAAKAPAWRVVRLSGVLMDDPAQAGCWAARAAALTLDIFIANVSLTAATSMAKATELAGIRSRFLEQSEQIRLLRDIFGNPFRPVAFAPSWRTSTAIALARQMYASRDFSPMLILADALQDAGCEQPGILAHCRGDGPHVRGCWVVDLVLGKA